MFEGLLAVKKAAPVIPGGYALFHSGNRNGSTYAAMDRYKYSDNTYLSLVALVLAKQRTAHACVGNYTLLVIGTGTTGAGGVQASTDLYVYASGAYGSGTNLLTSPRTEGTSFGQNTKGYFLVGADPSVARLTSDRYTYAGNVVAAGASVSQARTLVGGAGNATFGYVFGGFLSSTPQRTVDKYAYASDSSAATTQLAVAGYRQRACGTPSMAYVGGGVEAAAHARVYKWDYSTDTQANGTNLTVVQQDHAAASNNTTGIFAGGRVAITNVSTYTFANDSVIAGAVLPTGRHSFTGGSSEPGGFTP